MKEAMKKQIKSLREEGRRVENGVRDTSLGYIIAGLGFVAGLAWNDAIKTGIEQLFPLSRNAVAVKFLYAFAVTVVVVFISSCLVRLFKKDEGK